MAETEKRRRNAEATRAAIETAARRHFMRKGYGQVGLREIARDAGVDPALVSRYFGSKEGLFEAAVLPFLNLDALIAGEIEGFAARAAAFSVDVAPGHKKDFDATRALLLSLGSDEVKPQISAALRDAMVAPLAARLGGDQPEMRAALAMARLMGFDALNRVARLDALTEADRDALRAGLGAALQTILDGPGPADPA